MENKRLSAVEIIDHIASLYTLDTRSANGKQCVYNHKDGRMCAFAYMVKDELRFKLIEHEISSVQIDKFGKNIIKDEFAGYPSIFYKQIQELHDNENNWNESGLSDKGIALVTKLKEQYN